MEKLFVMDEQNYSSDMPVLEKHSVRAIIVKDGLVATQHGNAGDYKILGGGIEEGESHEEALIREVREEAGLVVKPESIEAIGEVEELRRDRFDSSMTYHCHSYIYRCQVGEERVEPEMTASEIEKGYHLAWATPEEIVEAGQKHQEEQWICRDARIIHRLFMEKK